ncbi:hypothetical protein EHS25_005448 [Saitozyma podzolica]|uniref:Apiosidase-like catalytic domain-containing protein n=1 Tax=Saitozyma podzolica TaxID=1890683 RepID=A0A427XYE3_9TREE|nr:hypothetical protein EHS25_005448 [Saitozyma podzolica]
MSHFKPRTLSDISQSLSVALAPSSNGRFIVRHVNPNEPFFYLADTAWELFHRLDDAEAETYLRNRADKGFNVIMIVVLAEQDGLVLPNRDGALPLQTPIELLADGGSLGPKSLNPDYFAFIDRILPLAASLGLTVALVPTWGRYINGGLHEGPVIFNETNSYEYGLFLGERYPFHPFILGGDTNRYWNMKAPKAVEAGEDVTLLKVHDCGRITESMARGIAEGEKRAVQALPADIKEKVKDYQSFITYHSTQGWLPSAPPASGSAQFPEASWLSLDGVQTGHSETQFNENLEPSKNVKMWRSRSPYLPIRQMYNTPRPDGRPRPVIDLEPHYEATHYKFNRDLPIWEDADIRNGAWQSLFAGACGYTYGCNSIWQFHNPESKTHPPITGICAYTPWYLELDLPGTFQVALMRNIMLSSPNYFTRVPDQSFIVSSTGESNDRSEAGDALISGTRAQGWAMVTFRTGARILEGVLGGYQMRGEVWVR